MRECRDQQPHQRHRSREQAQHQADRRGAEAALVPQDRHQEGVQIPARREQPVHHQQAPQARRAEQVPGAVRARPGHMRRHHLHRHASRPPQAQQRQQHQHAERDAKAAPVDQQPGHHRPEHVGHGGREAEPAEHALELGRPHRAAAGGALDRNQPVVRAGAGEQRRQAQHDEVMRRGPGGRHREGATDHGERHRHVQRPVVAVAVREAAGLQREQDRRGGEQAHQHPDRPGRVALPQHPQRPGHAHTGHRGVQADLADDQRGQHAANGNPRR